MSSFFQETCKVLGIRRTRTTSYHHASNRMLERWHKDFHNGLSHYINSANTKLGYDSPVFFMARRATPHSVTGYSPFYLLHRRGMQLPSNDSLKVRCVRENTSQDRRLENLKASLRMAYNAVAKANKKAHRNNKRFYDRKAKTRHFDVNDLVYLYTPALKAGQTKKFQKFWSGPYTLIRKISELNYETVGQDDKKIVVHLNRLKRCYNQSLWKPRQNHKAQKKPPKRKTKRLDSGEEEEIRVGPFPLMTADNPTAVNESTTPQNPALDTPDTDRRTMDTPSSKDDPSYYPLDTPRSRRELQTMRTEPPITRSRARNMLQDVTDA